MKGIGEMTSAEVLEKFEELATLYHSLELGDQRSRGVKREVDMVMQHLIRIRLVPYQLLRDMYAGIQNKLSAEKQVAYAKGEILKKFGKSPHK